jgi:hypothetical protein
MAQAGLVVPISGPYLGTWNAFVLGTQNDDGFEITATIKGQEIAETDAYGMTLVEAIYRGQDWRLRLRGLEWKQGLLDSLQATGQRVANSLSPAVQAIGQRWTTFGQSMVLTAILGNPPTTPQSLTALSCVVAPNSQSAFLMTSKMRELPIEYILFPYLTILGSVTWNVPFVCT